MSSPPTSAEIIVRLELRPHPEGGHYRETFRDSLGTNGRARSTAIYFLLARGERSHWHRIDTAEVWHYYAGSPLNLQIANENCPPHTVKLGPDIAAGDWTLVGCTVAPAFEFASFELAPKGWEPCL